MAEQGGDCIINLLSVVALRPSAHWGFYAATKAGLEAIAAMNIGADFEGRVVDVRNARLLDPPASLGDQGFTLVEHVTGVGIALVNSGLGRDRLIDAVEVFVDPIESRLFTAPD